MKTVHICPKCGEESEVSFEYWNFKCVCGYKAHLIMRRELMDLTDSVEGELAVLMAGECLKT
ncbi:MAG: hypothetical protein A2174_03205 [Candidatus Portnoybacteria bacterium RBG_13_41_18]|uniref:Uncharacterized protein n=1 Tax=Candidatus Portnoybacteria bacterium RBG_13_41_18 TaxID=1801991 RepID=A0A1G2F5C0_9BACT|nr:MAG: hypothetical protein A2174_03205 [Candidatus Portnoybacteria bacterium RBG_13_41_18]